MTQEQGNNGQQQFTSRDVQLLVVDFLKNESEEALNELSKKRDKLPDLAPILWHSVGVIAKLMKEIVSIYPLLDPPALTASMSNKVCSVIALFQTIASHPETKPLLYQAQIPLFLYPFLTTTSPNRPFEYLRLASLGVIGALVKNDNSEIIQFLLQTHMISHCIRIMGIGSELSKIVSTYIVQKILDDNNGLKSICELKENSPESVEAICDALGKMVDTLADQPSIRLLKHIIRCYLRFAENESGKERLKSLLPLPLKNNTFSDLIKDDSSVINLLKALQDKFK
eukprot:Anaeramoba_ignava/a3862_27.p2 GENE.a3862_27~~a3862_27.p2  ORF type:complete len:284 (+),score=60.31 a3862_27:2675-3526(+)